LKLVSLSGSNSRRAQSVSSDLGSEEMDEPRQQSPRQVRTFASMTCEAGPLNVQVRAEPRDST